MQRTKRLITISLILTLTSLLLPTPALAIPPLPSSFYGRIKINAANIAEGTVIEALIDGQVFAEAYSQTYKGDSVFALDVPGDDTSTSAKEGGREGDVIQFNIGGIPADQTAVWHGGTNSNLDLSASASVPVRTPKPTRTTFPTQTPIKNPSSSTPVVQPSETAAGAGQTLATATEGTQLTNTPPRKPNPSVTITNEAQGSTTPTNNQPTQTPIPIGDEANHSTTNSQMVVIVILLFVLAASGFAFLYFRKK